MHPRVARRVVQEHTSVIVSHPAIGEQDIGDIPDPFLTNRSEGVSRRSGDDMRRVVKSGHVHVQHITQTGRTSAHTVSQMQPSL